MNINVFYDIFSRLFRTRRMHKFQKLFGLVPENRVLDVGGTLFNWSLLSEHPRLTILNFSLPREKERTISWIVADGRYLPFKDNVFDIVFSNSVIEHLGTFDNQHLFSAECRRVGRGYYVQTPNKWFPIESHLITPFIHWLRPSLQKKLLRNFTLRGLITRPTKQKCDEMVEEIRLLNKQDMRMLFSEAKILRECFLGLTKSLIAIKTSQ